MTSRAPLAAVLLALAPAAQAAMPKPEAQIVHIIGTDRGGVIATRSAEVAWVNNHGHAVQIEGHLCLSTCTMWLGAKDVCVSPQTRFGFHGPSNYGRPLEPEHFESASKLIASHYPVKAVRDWYMTDARYTLTGYRAVLGSELIRLGVEECQ